jgi:hypothetical protein
VKKTVPLALARYRAKQYLSNKQKTKVFESLEYYEFRNYPKRWFRNLQEKKINEELQLIIGSLNVPTDGKSTLASE